MRILLLTLLLLVAPVTAFPQKAFKSVKVALKAKNYKEAVSQIEKLRKDSLLSNSPKLYLYSVEAQRGLNDAENMKLYLKQSYDTLAFFSTTHCIIREAVKLDSIEVALMKNEARKPKETDFVCEQLRRYYPNLNAAARFFYKHRKFSEAMGYLRTCLELPHTEVGLKARLRAAGEVSNACLYLTAAYQLQQYGEVHRYENLALRDTLLNSTILECLANTAEAEADSAAYRQWLLKGMQNHPLRPVFFTRLVDFYTLQNNFQAVYKLSQWQLQRDSIHVPALLAMCIAQLNLHQFDACIVSGRNLLKVDSTNVEANYYVGASYVAKALLIDLPENAFSADYRKAHRTQIELYRQAEPYLERYRALAPKSQKRWAPLLYKVYLALNRGNKFAEIEKQL